MMLSFLPVLLSLWCGGIQGMEFKKFAHDAHRYSAGHYGAKFNRWLAGDLHTAQTPRAQVESPVHYEHMLENFASNDDLILRVNAQNLTYSLGHNQFSHMDRDEWNRHRGAVWRPGAQTAAQWLHSPEAAGMSERRKLPDSLPPSVDWSKVRGIVTPVKEQGLCGSCYAFAAVAALESAYNVRHNYDADRRVGGPNMQTFSEQQVVDCDRNGDSGCVGGAMENVYGWAAGLGYLCTQDSYRYVSGESQRHEACAQAACDKVRAAAPLSYSEVQPRSDQALMAAIAAVPVSVGIDANADDFQFYKSGVYAGKCGTVVNHGLLAVGYGTSRGGEPYYKFKNCWGRSWGNDGYIKVRRAEADAPAQGRCALLSQITYPNLR